MNPGVPALLVAAAVLPGCGGAGAAGSATLWVTRDLGAHVLVSRSVPAGLTGTEALSRAAKTETSYGGRFVQAIDGVSNSAHRSWFYYVNGYLADRGAAEYQLHRGDIEWWDYHPWRNPDDYPLAVGAFPEPFLHGYDGHRRRAVVRYSGDARGARALALVVHADQVAVTGTPVPAGANVFVLEPATGASRFEATFAGAGGTAGAPVRFVYRGDWRSLIGRPAALRYRYAVVTPP